MFDAGLRRVYAPMVDAVARSLHAAGVSAIAVTGAGLVLGLSAAGFAAAGWWWAALGSWLASRVVDGIDGAVARVEGSTASGGFVDLVADFTVYAAFVAGVAVAVPGARLAAVVLLCTYYVSGAAFLAWSSLRPEPIPWAAILGSRSSTIAASASWVDWPRGSRRSSPTQRCASSPTGRHRCCGCSPRSWVSRPYSGFGSRTPISLGHAPPEPMFTSDGACRFDAAPATAAR